MTTTTYTYTMHHPQLSEPLIIDAPIARENKALTAWATIYIMRNFDELVSPEDWIIEQECVDPTNTGPTYRPTSELVELTQGFLNDFEIHVADCPILRKGEREGMGGVHPVEGDIEEHIAAEIEIYQSQDQGFERSHWTICDCCDHGNECI